MPAFAGIFVYPQIIDMKAGGFSMALRLFSSLFVWLAIGFLPSATAWSQELPQTNLQRVRVGAGMYQIDVQLALTPAEQQTGLMHRKDMAQQEGMLFVFPQPSTQCFWMKNTLLPLTAAFVADDGRIVNLVDMKPMSLDSHCSEEPVRYVLEMNQGWFAKKNIKAGFKLSGESFKPSR